MKKIFDAILRNPKTSLMGVASALVSILIYYKVITVEASVLYLGLIGTILGLLSSDAKLGGVVINEVDALPTNPTDNNQWYHISGDTYFWYDGTTWQSFTGQRPTKPPHS